MQPYNNAAIVLHIHLSIPLVLPYLINLNALCWIGVEDLCDEVSALVAHKRRYLIVCVQDLFI